jgi:GR25 family glycosyltransferase involved in LPS biosynthesis
MKCVDMIYYTNLDHRIDRKAQFLQEMKKMGVPDEKIHRIDPVYIPQYGALGACRSQIRIIEHFIQHSYQCCIILEDDIEFRDPATVEKKIEQFLTAAKNDWDVVMLGANVVRAEAADLPLVKKVYDAQTNSAYMINKSFAPTLLKNFKEGAARFENFIQETRSSLFKRFFRRPKPEDFFPYAFDIYWKQLQPVSRWYVFQPCLCHQRAGFSDILGKHADYKC